MKRSITFIFFAILSLQVCAQHQLVGKKFVIITYAIDGHGEWLNFLTDSTCVHSKGSVSWGTSSDTLNYTVLKDRIRFKGIDNSKGVLNKKGVDIEYYSQKQIKDDDQLSRSKTHFRERDATGNKVIYLKVK